MLCGQQGTVCYCTYTTSCPTLLGLLLLGYCHDFSMKWGMTSNDITTLIVVCTHLCLVLSLLWKISSEVRKVSEEIVARITLYAIILFCCDLIHDWLLYDCSGCFNFMPVV